MNGNIQFIVNQPASPEQIGDHIRHALSLNLPEADSDPRRHLTIIATGPSAAGVDLKAIKGDTLAVNGALRQFTEQGLYPTGWCACDPQELVADFLPDNPPHETCYLVASKCHPAVFKRLEGRHVRLWHLRSPGFETSLRTVPVASTVTLCAIRLMHRAYGYNSFDVHGWDACYLDGQHHLGHPREPTEHDIEVIANWTEDQNGARVGGQTFQTRTNWALEAQDAVIMLHHADYEVKIHGDGLVRAMVERKSQDD